MLSEARYNTNFIYLNMLGLLGVSGVLLLAFTEQLVFNHLPCPLCLLQRLGIMAIGLGYMMNLYYDLHPRHYGMAIFAAVLTIFPSMRQILLHIMPGDQGYGGVIFGYHLYTWAFIASLISILINSVLLGFSHQYKLNTHTNCVKQYLGHPRMKICAYIVIGIFLTLVGLNIFSLFLECGFVQCPDNPVSYVLLG